MQKVLAYIMRGRVQAILVISALMFMSIRMELLSLFAGASMALVALRLGTKEGVMVTVASAVAVAVLTQLTLGIAWLGLARVLILGLPVLLLSLVWRQTVSIAAVMQTIALIGLMVVLSITALGEPFAEAWQGHLDKLVRPTLEMASQRSGGPITAVEIDKFLDLMTKMRSGLVASVMASSLIMTMLLGRWWQSLLYNPGGFRQEFHALQLGKSMAASTAVLIVLATVTKGAIGNMALNLLGVVFLIYLVQGMALVHSLVAITQAVRGWLVGVYVLLFIGLVVFPPVLMLLVFAAFIDTWINFRARVARQT